MLTRAGRRRKDRPDRLLHQIRHDRAELYERVGRKAQARREFEKLYAEAPEFEGLAEGLGLRWIVRQDGRRAVIRCVGHERRRYAVGGPLLAMSALLLSHTPSIIGWRTLLVACFPLDSRLAVESFCYDTVADTNFVHT